MIELIAEDSNETIYYNFDTNNYIVCTKSHFIPLPNESWPKQTEEYLKNCKRLRKQK